MAFRELLQKAATQVDALIDAENYAGAKELIERILTVLPPARWERHWWLIRYSELLALELEFERALEFSTKAYSVAPTCPLVVWCHADVLDGAGSPSQAIALFDRIISRGEADLAADPCGEGKEWAEALVTDSWYRLALAHVDLRPVKDPLLYFPVARSCLETALSRLDRGLAGTYPRELVQEAADRVAETIEREP